MAKNFSIPASDFDAIKSKVDTINCEGNKPFTLTFLDKKVYRPDNSTATVCEMVVLMNWNIPDELQTIYTNCPNNVVFPIKAVAVCHEDDEFDEKKGRIIAMTKAESKAYEEAFRRLSLLGMQFARLVYACETNMKKLSEYWKHNKTFMEELTGTSTTENKE